MLFLAEYPSSQHGKPFLLKILEILFNLQTVRQFRVTNDKTSVTIVIMIPIKQSFIHILKDTYLWIVLHVNHIQQHCDLMQYFERNNMPQVQWLQVTSVSSGSHDIFVVGSSSEHHFELS